MNFYFIKKEFDFIDNLIKKIKKLISKSKSFKMKNFKIIFLFYYILYFLISTINSNLNAPVLIVLAVNNYYIPYVSVMIESLIYNSNRKRSYKLYILNTNISLKNKENLKHLIKKNKNFSIKFINVNKFIENKNLNIFAHLTIETYFRFLIFDLFQNQKKFYILIVI